jgi:hypothetical protein
LSALAAGPEPSWFGNGLWALIVALGLLLSALLLHSAREWTLLK